MQLRASDRHQFAGRTEPKGDSRILRLAELDTEIVRPQRERFANATLLNGGDVVQLCGHAGARSAGKDALEVVLDLRHAIGDVRTEQIVDRASKTGRHTGPAGVGEGSGQLHVVGAWIDGLGDDQARKQSTAHLPENSDVGRGGQRIARGKHLQWRRINQRSWQDQVAADARNASLCKRH